MLRILRKIKHGKPGGENSGSFWSFAIAESVLIFLGILIALQVDNWNQDRKDRKLERVLLSEMLSNLKSIGIDLIRNEKLRHEITTVYTVAYNHVKANEDVLFDFMFDKLYPSLRENLRTISPREKTVPMNLDQLRQNNSFKEDLNMTIFVYGLSLRAYWRASEAIGQLIADIEEELGLEPGEST